MSTNFSRVTPSDPFKEAAAWFARQRLGSMLDDDAAAFKAWLQSSPDNALAWECQQQLWNRLETVRNEPAVLTLREDARTRARQHRMRRATWQWGIGLAASLMLGAFAWQWQGSAPDVIRLNSSSALIVPAAKQIRALARVRDVSTHVGERALVQLSDGTKVTLNTDTAIHADFSGKDRAVTLLRGEAYFEVAKDKSRAFVVSAGSHEVIAVGTAFDVRLQPQQLQVKLVEGKVRVRRISSHTASNAAEAITAIPVMLEAGSSLVAPSDGHDRIEPLNATREISWRTGKLVFQGDRLAVVVAEMNRYSTQELKILDPRIEDRMISGVVDPSGGAEFARTLESYGMVRIVAQDSSAISLAAP
jgi:transmembrane sensor